MCVRFLLILSVFALNTACGGSSSSGENFQRVLTESDVDIDYIDGVWLSSRCISDETNNRYYTTTFRFSSGVYTVALVYYEDDACTNLNEGVQNFQAFGTYSLGLAVDTSSGFTAYQVNLVRRADNALQETIVYNTGNLLYFGDSQNGALRSNELDFSTQYELQVSETD